MNPDSSIRGVYKITSRATGRVYIGCSADVAVRWDQHRGQLRGGTHYNRGLQSLWDQHGEADLVFSVLEAVRGKRNLLARESFWIRKTPLELALNHRSSGKSNATIRFSPEERADAEEKMKAYGFAELSPFILYAVRQ